MGVIGDWIRGTLREGASRASAVELGMIGGDLGRARDADDLAAAAEALERAFRNRARELGSMHPETLRYRLVLLRLRLWLQAPSLGEELDHLIRDCTTSLEPPHVVTLDARLLAAELAAAQGRPFDAERLARRVVADALPHHGTGSTLTRTAQAVLAQLLADTGRPAEALDIAGGLIQACGPRSAASPMPAVLRAWGTAALALGRFGEAEGAVVRLYEIEDQLRLDGSPALLVQAAPFRILDARVKLARDHPKRAESLARILAEELEAPAGCGERNAVTIEARLVQAAALLALGRAAAADPIAARMSEVAWHQLGPTHPLALTARFVRANALSMLGNAEVAAAEHAVVHAARRESLGVDHPDTLASSRAVTGFR